MRLILNFIFFGLLFYGLYVFFPQVFETLVSWAAAIFEFIREMANKLMNAAHTEKPPIETH